MSTTFEVDTTSHLAPYLALPEGLPSDKRDLVVSLVQSIRIRHIEVSRLRDRCMHVAPQG
jgi:hypothetical protein